MNWIKRTRLIPLFCLLAACGAYFADTGNLKDGHVEGTNLLGAWGNGESLFRFTDGPETADRFCFVEDDTQIKGQANIVPVTGGHLIVLSNIIVLEEGKDTPLVGEYLYLQADNKAGDLDLIQPFTDIETGDTLPFATECPIPQPEGTLAEMGFTPFCLNPGTNAEDIVTWARDQSAASVDHLTTLPNATLPPFCAGQ